MNMFPRPTDAAIRGEIATALQGYFANVAK